MNIFEKLQFKDLGVGRVQSADEMAIVPIVGPSRGVVANPESLIFEKTTSYGTMVFKNEDRERPAIVPSNLMVRGVSAQDHAMSGSGVVTAGKSKKFENACCIEASQGGFLRSEGNELDILPAEIRKSFLDKNFRQRKDYGKLWERIKEWVKSIPAMRSGARAHLRDFYDKPEFKDALEKFAAEFEPIPGQIGALILFNGVPVGLEIMPSHEHWKHYWQYLVRGCYGAELLRLKTSGRLKESQLVIPKIPANASPEEVKDLFTKFGEKIQSSILPMLDVIDIKNMEAISSGDAHLKIRMLQTNSGGGGDLIIQGEEPVYLSIIL